MKPILTLLLSLLLCSAYAQKDYSAVYQGDSIIKQGIRLHDQEKYADAIKQFNRITITDPQYLYAQYEKALSLSVSQNNDELQTHLENLRSRMPEYPSLYIIYGNFLSNQEKLSESEIVFKEAEKHLSNSATYYFNTGILYLRMEERQKAADALKKAVHINPNYASAHYFLGLLALEDGQVSQGTIALMSYLALVPSGKYSENAILKMNLKYGENFLDKPKLKLSDSGDNFDELDQILRNQLALSKNYKIKSTIDENVIRQMQAVAEYSSGHKSENGFFETTYLPWIKALYDRNQFEGFSYYSLESMEGKLGKKLTSQKKKTTAFYNSFMKADFWDLYATRKMDIFGQEKEVAVYLKNGEPYYMGSLVNGKKEGKYKILGESGIVSGEFNYKNDEIDGIQKYYNQQGKLIEEKTFANGKLDGTRTQYYSNGNIQLVENYKNDKLNGISTSYHVNGGKNCEGTYLDGDLNGTLTCVFANGSKQSEATYKVDKIEGVASYYNEAGDLTSKITFKNGERDGQSIQYYDGKLVKSQGEYSNGKGLDTYKYLYSNGATESEIFYVNGKIVKKIFYNSNGQKSSEEYLDANEVSERLVYFDRNGTLYFEEKYKNGEYKGATQYGETIAKPVEVAASKKKFVMNTYDGMLLTDGLMDKGRNIGEWNYRYSNGVIRNKKNFVAGNLEGIATIYFRNGDLSQIIHYKNDQLHGRYEDYDYGRLKNISNYINDVQQGPYQYFYPDGTLQSESYAVDAEISGVHLSYWHNKNVLSKNTYIENAITTSEFFDLDGKSETTLNLLNKTGTVVINLRNGVVTETRNYTDGILNGKYSIQDKSGDKISEHNFVNGLKHGLAKNYSPTGKLLYEGKIYSDKSHGTHTWYDLVGNLRLTIEYLFGDETGKTTRYYHNKNKMWDYTEFNGSKGGEYKYYNLKGEAVLVINYLDNAAVSFKTLQKDGSLGNSVAILDDNADIVSKYSNDKTAISLQLKKGEIEGKIAIYGIDGQLNFEAFYKKGRLDAERNEYYANGKIYKKERFKDGDYDGKSEFFKEDGKPWVVANYAMDMYHGDFLIYTNGTLSKTKKYDSDELISISK